MLVGLFSLVVWRICLQQVLTLIVVGEMIPPDVVTFAERVKGLVTDEGGILSHAATVARELGIPCVVGTGNATEVLQDGDSVEVIGDKGEVYLV